MNKHIQVRDFDGKLYNVLAKRAKASGLSLSQYIRQELAKLARTPPINDVLEELINLPREQSTWKEEESARLVREAREERDEHFDTLFGTSADTHKRAS